MFLSPCAARALRLCHTRLYPGAGPGANGAHPSEGLRLCHPPVRGVTLVSHTRARGYARQYFRQYPQKLENQVLRSRSSWAVLQSRWGLSSIPGGAFPTPGGIFTWWGRKGLWGVECTLAVIGTGGP
eukprot:8184659-Pyramimonas_sp.AAC.1